MFTNRFTIIVPFIMLAIAVSTLTAAGADDLITLAKSGVDEEVIKAYIENTTTPFVLTSADIVILKDLGVSSKLIIEALKHDQPNDSLLNTEPAIMHQEPNTETPTTTAFSPVTAPPEAEQNLSFFYSALYPYGTWINIDGNLCWQPNATIIDGNWSPYCNHGHWEWTDYGWTWVSSYTWGWAPFHYGRWFHRADYGWLWQPDNEWGPAWVVWRTGQDYCGWAPLPPRSRFVRDHGFFFDATFISDDAGFDLSFSDFCFVPIEHFHDRHPFAHIVPSSHTKNIYKNTAFEKNSFSFANNHIINNGVQISVVEKATNTHITPFVLTEEHLRPGEQIHSSTLSGNKLLLFKPSISAATPLSITQVREQFTKSTSGSGQIITPKTNPQSWQILQNNQKIAADRATKNQLAIVQTAQTEQVRLNLEAQKEPVLSKQAALKGEEAVQALNVQNAQLHAQKVQSWKSPQEIFVPKMTQSIPQPVSHTEPAQAQSENRSNVNRQPANVPSMSRPTEQFQNQVKELNSEARMEQQHRETIESTVRTQAQSQWQQHQQVPEHKNEKDKR